MMLFGRGHEICQLLIAVLLCMPLAGQNTTSSPSTFTTATSSNASNTTTSSSETWNFLSKEDLTKIFIVVMSVTATGALLNFLVIIAIIIDPLKTVRKGPWITILNLAIADLISSISIFLFVAWTVLKPTENILYLDITIFCWGFGSSASFLWLTFFSVQIFVITNFPLGSRHWFTTVKIVLVGTAIWLFAFLVSFCEITPAFSLPYTTSLKMWIARISVLQVALVIQIVLNIQVTLEINRSRQSSGNPQNAKHKNIAMTVIILTLILFLTAFPYFLLKQLEFLADLGYFDHDNTSRVLSYLSYCYLPIAMLNFAANPIIYALRLPDYTQTLLAFVGKSSRRNSTNKRLSQLTNTFSLRSQRMSTASEKSQGHSTSKE